MKKLVFSFFALLITFSLIAQTAKNKSIKERILELENKAALKDLVDTFSILADQKDAQSQTFLFTENALVETYLNGVLSMKLEGRKQIGETFGNFLNLFKTVYHFNGQHSVVINGNRASGTLYCLTTLISSDNVKTTFGIHYNDEYVLEKGKWLIAKRTSNFDWTDVSPLGVR